MVRPIALSEPASPDNFDEDRYLAANPDVKAAVESGALASGRRHFDSFGKAEGRCQTAEADLAEMRRAKLAKLDGRWRTDMEHRVDADGRRDFLTEALREETKIADTDRVSANPYDDNVHALIDKHADGLVLDCGAGSRGEYFPNVVNFEIVAYRSTDVLGVGEHLPFADDTFDAVLSLAVLEHVRDPFRCAEELTRVLKPGGELLCVLPFLQPVHGYPHHYFNATPQGMRRLFEDRLEISWLEVPQFMHPVWSLSWMLRSWMAGLPEDKRAAFGAMTVDQLADPSANHLGAEFCWALSRDAQFEIACGTMLAGVKPKDG